MKNERIDRLLGYLAEISAFLSEVKFRTAESRSDTAVSEAVERYLDGFSNSLNSNSKNLPTQNLPAPTCRKDALQSNKQKPKVWTAKELKEMPYLKDLKYRKLKSGVHQFRYRRDGFNVSFNSMNFETAKAKARRFIVDLKRKLGYEIKPKHIDTLDYVAKLWFENKKHHVDISTWRGYMNVYLNHVQPAFGNRKIANILPMDLQPYFNDLSARLGKTCENAKIILKGTFDFAVANRMCPTNPMLGVIIEKHVSVPGKALNDEELVAFKQAMARTKTPFGLAGLIILYTGIRGAELHSLTFDWDAGTFTVKNAKLKKSQKVNPNNIYRTVPIFPALWGLKERIQTETWIIKPRELSGNFHRYWKGSSIKDLRHTFTTKAREAHIDNELVNLWTGHLPGKNVTANIYTHFSMDFQKEQAKKVPIY